MIVKTTKEINGVEYDYTYSDAGMMIERNGARYSEAIDPLGSGREYTETDEPIEVVTEEATEADYQNALAEFGVEGMA
jgi:hypothetical protein